MFHLTRKINMLAGQVHQNLLYLFRNTSRLFSTPGYRLGCDSGCCSRLRNLVSAGVEAIPKSLYDSWEKKLSMQPEHFFFSCTWWWNVFKLCETMCPWECQFHAQCLWKKLIKKILNNCRYMGTITEVSDADPVRWPSSYWRSVKVRVFSSWFFLVSFLLLLLAGSLYDLTLFFLPADFYTDHRFILWEVKLS
jgi:hypothetical protein